jgi:HEAT repeat protein
VKEVRARARAASALLGLVFLTACREPPARTAVVGVSVSEGLPGWRLEAMGISPEDLRRAALEALGATPGFEVQPAQFSRGARRSRATVALLEARWLSDPVPGGPAESAAPRWEVALELEVSPLSGEGSLREAARWAEPVRRAQGEAQALRMAVAGAARKAAGSLAVALAEAAKPDAEVIADLESGDPRIRDFAVRVLADRKKPAAVPPLLARLRDPDPEVVERAVGALAQIRDPRAVGPLIELTHRREGPFVAQLVRIVADIGGPEAEAFLSTMASGHPEPLVRQAAEEGLADLRRRKAPLPPPRP